MGKWELCLVTILPCLTKIITDLIFQNISPCSLSRGDLKKRLGDFRDNKMSNDGENQRPGVC